MYSLEIAELSHDNILQFLQNFKYKYMINLCINITSIYVLIYNLHINIDINLHLYIYNCINYFFLVIFSWIINSKSVTTGTYGFLEQDAWQLVYFFDGKPLRKMFHHVMWALGPSFKVEHNAFRWF